MNSIMIESGGIYKSATGRELSAAPRVDCTSDRKCLNTLKRMHKWLKEESIKECEACKNDFAKMMVESIQLNNISTSDIESMNMILFDPEFSTLAKRGD